MYNLIVAVMSIALIGMTTFAALSYGGVILSQKGGQGSARAQAVTLLTNAQQVAGAQRAYQAEHSGNLANSYQALIDAGYLRAVPELPVGAVIGGWSMTLDGTISMIPLSLDRDGRTGSPADRICELLPDFGGSAFIPAGGAAPSVADLDGVNVWFACVTDPGAPSVEGATQVWFAHRT
ncbi:MAG: hypothetical protein KC466_19105 [Myxococcales bacterium]|nr:hypothetical protein [Myxococcales bacterium]